MEPVSGYEVVRRILIRCTLFYPSQIRPTKIFLFGLPPSENLLFRRTGTKFSVHFEMYSRDGLYHFFNQGINGQAIFRIEENYDFFLEKVKKHLLPNAHVLAFCLMYNHFHFLLRPTEFGASQSNKKVPVHGKDIENEMLSISNLSYGVQMLLSTYTRGFNKAYHRSGNLFRQGSNMKQCWDLRGTEDGGQGSIAEPSYPHTVFHYVHQNPVNAGISLDAKTWEWSSAREYEGPYDRGVCDFKMAESLLGVKKFRE